MDDAETFRRCPGRAKQAWPELLGADGQEAKRVIERENGQVRAHIVVVEDQKVIHDFRCDRVWVWVHRADGRVASVPMVG